MAACSFNHNGRTFTLEVWEKSYSIENNTSDVNWKLSISGGGTTWYNSYAKATVNGTVVFNETKDWSTGAFPAKDGEVSGTITGIGHDSEGRKNISFALEGYSYSYSTQYTNGSLTLTNIPRASSIAVSNANLGQNIGITIGKKNNSYTSTLTYKIGTRTGIIVNKTTLASYVWEMTPQLISQIKTDNPSNKNPTATIYCETYSGNTKIGNTTSASFTLTITDKPIINNVSMAETIELISEYTESIVKYISAPKFEISAETSEGSSISSYQITVGDISASSASNEITINNIQYSYLDNEVRKTKFIVKVTDARGNVSNEYEIVKDFIEYVRLTFNNTDISFTRLNGTSNTIKVNLSGYAYYGLFGGTQNSLTLAYRYKEKGTSEWSNYVQVNASINQDNTFALTNYQMLQEFDYRKNYDIEFLARDLFISTSYESVIKSSETIAKWHKNGAYIKHIDTQQIKVNGEDIFNINKIYPVGSIYMSVKSTNPATLFGGTWEQLKDRFLLGTGNSYTNGSIGGESMVTLNINQIPPHTHGQQVTANPGTGSINGRRDYVSDANGLSGYPQGIDTYSTGGGQAHNNMPPYLVVYMWKRVS